MQEEERKKLAERMSTPAGSHLKEGTHHEGDDEVTGTSDFTMSDVANVGSELERVHIAEKNKAMAAKLKVGALLGKGDVGFIGCCSTVCAVRVYTRVCVRTDKVCVCACVCACICTIIWFYFVLYLISYAAVRTKIKRTNIFQQCTRVSYTIWGAYEIKTARNNNVRNIFNAKYNQITVYVSCVLYVSSPTLTYIFLPPFSRPVTDQ